MKCRLRMLAVVVGVLTLGVWLWTGAHLGWTKTQVTVMKLDPITELEYPETQKRFVAGVEVLGGGLLLALILLGGSLCFPPSCNHNRKEKQP